MVFYSVFIMKTLVISAVLLLAVAAVASPIGLSFAQMPEQAQEKMAEKAQGNMTEQYQEGMPEQANEVLASLENFGVEVSDFVRDAMSQFQNQKQDTISQIKQCREDMMEAEPSERSQVRQDCRASLDEIRETYRDIRGIFQETFLEFRESIEVLRDDAQGEQVSDEDRQAAIDDIRETAKARHLQMQTGQNGMNVEELREKMKSAHRGP
jgi:N-methylhydantoinase A/oxoprolinase/acetone carboxylase beta subunit